MRVCTRQVRPNLREIRHAMIEPRLGTRRQCHRRRITRLRVPRGILPHPRAERVHGLLLLRIHKPHPGYNHVALQLQSLQKTLRPRHELRVRVEVHLARHLGLSRFHHPQQILHLGALRRKGHRHAPGRSRNRSVGRDHAASGLNLRALDLHIATQAAHRHFVL